MLNGQKLINVRGNFIPFQRSELSHDNPAVDYITANGDAKNIDSFRIRRKIHGGFVILHRNLHQHLPIHIEHFQLSDHLLGMSYRNPSVCRVGEHPDAIVMIMRHYPDSINILQLQIIQPHSPVIVIGVIAKGDMVTCA